jgi:hypothetical protein
MDYRMFKFPDHNNKKKKKVLPKEKKTRNSLVTHTSWGGGGGGIKKKGWKLEAGSPMINEERSTKLKCVPESISS